MEFYTSYFNGISNYYVVNKMDREKVDLIAPCGIHCGVCIKYLERRLLKPISKSGPCDGCRQRNKNCAFIKKGCSEFRQKKITYCFECKQYPCDRLKILDARYQRDYQHSLIENLEYMKSEGFEAFLHKMEKTFQCEKCGNVISVHNGFCYGCEEKNLLEYIQHKKTGVRKNPYRIKE